MACGTRKTLSALFITEKLPPKRPLVLVPPLSLLAQTRREPRLTVADIDVSGVESARNTLAVLGNRSKFAPIEAELCG